MAPSEAEPAKLPTVQSAALIDEAQRVPEADIPIQPAAANDHSRAESGAMERRSELVETALDSQGASQRIPSKLQSADYVQTGSERASSRKLTMDEVQVTEPEMARQTPTAAADKDHELSRYSVAQHQVNMPLTDYYDQKYGGSAGPMASNFGQRYAQEQDDRRQSAFYAQAPPSDTENPLMAQARLMRQTDPGSQDNSLSIGGYVGTGGMGLSAASGFGTFNQRGADVPVNDYAKTLERQRILTRKRLGGDD